MTLHIPGIHHVTAISGPAQTNLAFFTGPLGQSLVKRTVNFDDPGTYHLYYADPKGTPGTVLTFFPITGATRGVIGPGMASAYAYAIPKADFDATVARLRSGGIPARLSERFGARVATIADPDGAPVELIEDASAPDAHGFHSVTLWERDPDRTARLLTDVFGYEVQGSETLGGVERLRLKAPGNERANQIDVIRSNTEATARPGTGTIHHIAFRALTPEDQLAWIDKLASAGHRTTEVRDRNYFTSIYFREPGGVLFEIATDPPGFAVDEDPAELGRALKLPPQYEPMRAQIERTLPPLKVAE